MPNIPDIAIYIAAGVAGLILVVIAIALLVKRAKEKGRKVGSVKVSKGVRYTKDELVLDESGDVKISLAKGDVLLLKGKEYIVKKKTGLLPGKYAVLSAAEETPAVNIRMGGFVREYKHFEAIVLVEDDIICAVSHNVVLR